MKSREYSHYDGVHSFLERNTKTGDMTQWVNVLAVQALYLIPQTYMIEGENELHSFPLTSTWVCMHTH